jgi:hypothetical protein
MKIIGITGKGFIVETDKDELSNLVGYQSDFSRTYNTSQRKEFKIGDQIEINAMFDRLYRMANKEKELMEISAKLKAAADFVDASLPTVKHVNGPKEEEASNG